MGKKSRKARTRVEPSAGQPAEVGPRQPCPCGSGRRYKACHGNPGGATPAWRSRPFEGLPGECDLIALREFVPAATAPLTLTGTDRSVQLCTLLPGAAPAMVRGDGGIWLGLQVQHGYGDPSRDLAAVLTAALDASPDAAPDSGTGAMIGLTTDPGEGPRLQDLVADVPLEVTVHGGFDYWAAGLEDPEMLAPVLEQANATVSPTARIDGVEAAYWTSIGEREYLRWVRPEAEDPLLDALARLHHAEHDRLVEGARLLGMFRAHGVLVPVWELPSGTGPEALSGDSGPVAAFDRALSETLAEMESGGRPLDSAERSSRAGLTSRQITIR